MDYRLDDATSQVVVGHYIKALDVYRKAQEAATLFGGKWPHDAAIVAGGVTEQPTADKMVEFIWRLEEIVDFVDNIYIPDVMAVAKVYSDYLEMGKGCQNLLAYDAFRTKTNGSYDSTLFKSGLVTGIDKYSEFDVNKITEDVAHSWFKDGEPLYPGEGKTEPDPEKAEGYSWLKSPRYNGEVFEVGPLASVLSTYLSKKDPLFTELVESSLSELGGTVEHMYSVAGRHLARALSAKIIASQLLGWAQDVKIGQPTTAEYDPPQDGQGVGLTAAPRGALGHWLNVKDGRISNYQVITPTAWNASPKDNKGQPGPYEQALIGLKVSDSQAPIEILRTIRSFDPCTACAVHLVTPKGDLLGKYKAVL
jgi:hydrogenase large subunit